MEGLNRFRHNIGEEKWQRLVTRLGEVNRDIRARGILSLPVEGRRLWDVLTGYSYGQCYDWDLYFENIYMSYYGISRFCRNNLEAFLNKQLACGFVQRMLTRDDWDRQHFKPFLAQTALLGCRQTGFYDWLNEKFYVKLRKYVDHWFWYWDFDKNGLCVWDSADHSGMDNQIARAGDVFSLTVEGVDLNCYLLRELQAMAILAAKLGRNEDAGEYAEHAERLEDLINDVFWDDEDAFYYDRNERTGEAVRLKTVCGFIPLWANDVPADRARRLVQEHLVNEDEFWVKYPVATWSRSEAGYYQNRKHTECNWCGPTWIPTNYMIFHGLRRHGFDDIARELAYKTFDLALSEADTREYYNGETGVGLGVNPFWGWSTLAYFMPLEYELGYDPTDLQRAGHGPACGAREEIIALGSDVLGIPFESQG